VYVDDDQTLYVADYGNSGIMKWKCGATNGQVVAGGHGIGNQMNQLNFPVDVIVDKEKSNMIICDLDNRRVVQCPLQNDTTEKNNHLEH
jgi:sugar lactone lactonase YvrE